MANPEGTRPSLWAATRRPPGTPLGGAGCIRARRAHRCRRYSEGFTRRQRRIGMAVSVMFPAKDNRPPVQAVRCAAAAPRAVPSKAAMRPAAATIAVAPTCSPAPAPAKHIKPPATQPVRKPASEPIAPPAHPTLGPRIYDCCGPARVSRRLRAYLQGHSTLDSAAPSRCITEQSGRHRTRSRNRTPRIHQAWPVSNCCGPTAVGDGLLISTGFAQLPAVEDVTGLAGEERGVEIGVSLSLDVGSRVGRKGAAGDVEGLRKGRRSN